MAAMLAFFAAFAAGALVWLAAVARLGRLREFHHAYVGAALALLAPWPWLMVVGLAVLWDDAGQHALQAWCGVRWETRGGPPSPVHWLFRVCLYTPAKALGLWALVALAARGLK